jgi:hypothetical protein
MAHEELLQVVKEKLQRLVEGEDFYWEGGYLVFTSAYHLKRGSCCGSGCRHCPYEPPWIKGTTARRARVDESGESAR